MGRTTQERPLVIRPLKGTPKEVGNVQVARADEAHFRDLTARLPDVDRRFIAEGMRIVPKRDTYHTGALMHARRLAAADAELASSLDIPVVIFDDEDHSLTAGSLSMKPAGSTWISIVSMWLKLSCASERSSTRLRQN